MLVLGIILIIVGVLVGILAPRALNGYAAVGWVGPVLVVIGLILIILQLLGIPL